MKVFKVSILNTVSLAVLGFANVAVAEDSKEFSSCRLVKLVDGGKENIVTLCEKTSEPSKDTVLRPIGKVSS